MKLKILISCAFIASQLQGMQTTAVPINVIRAKATKYAQTCIQSVRSDLYAGRYLYTLTGGIAFCAFAYPLYLYAQAYGNYYKNSLNNFFHRKEYRSQILQERIGLAQVLTNHSMTKSMSYNKAGIAHTIKQFVVPDEENFEKIAGAHTLKLIADRVKASRAIERPIIVSLPGRVFVIHRSLPLNIAKCFFKRIFKSAFLYSCLPLLPKPYDDISHLLLPIPLCIWFIKQSVTGLIWPTNNFLRPWFFYQLQRYTRNLINFSKGIKLTLFFSFWMWATGLSADEMRLILKQHGDVLPIVTIEQILLQYVKDQTLKERLSQTIP